ncbi:MFS transporter [Cerasicoccus maritimus]|uniref:MFS transporter n=1 Tax=Cerasicoccus maritimus TaxID=490089 RepID=UPI0028528CE6|nr:MFS transporter [Cerasicoccus maritimus]
MAAAESVLKIPNIRWFIVFRVFFNARFYYPVFTVLFLDIGLTLKDFFLLNAIWAASIVLLEVPSGAFADTFGRRNLVRLAGVCMVVELAIIAFVPMGEPWLLLLAFGVNRLISGAAEAFASGADEALAYDSLKALGREKEWPNALDLLMRLQSLGFLGCMLLGAAVYDHEFVNAGLQLIGIDAGLTKPITLRFPLYLTLATSLVTLFAAWRLTEPPVDTHEDEAPTNARAAFALVGQTGKWILTTQIVLVLIVASVCFDSLVRIGLTINSEYYRMIGLPEAALGVMGAIGGLLGLFIPMLARKLVEQKSARVNFCLLAGLILLSQGGQALLIPYWGVIPAMGIGVSMFMLNFFMSHYLNAAVTDSHRRATVLSFRSLANNIAYGLAGLIFFGLTSGLAPESAETELTNGKIAVTSDAVFAQLLQAIPFIFLGLMAFLGSFTYRRVQMCSETPSNTE